MSPKAQAFKQAKKKNDTRELITTLNFCDSKGSNKNQNTNKRTGENTCK